MTMYTSVDKAIAAGIMAVLYVLYNIFGIDVGLSEGTVGSIAMILATGLTWLVPNKTIDA